MAGLGAAEEGRGVEAVPVAGKDGGDGAGRDMEAARGEVAAETPVAEAGAVPGGDDTALDAGRRLEGPAARTAAETLPPTEAR